MPCPDNATIARYVSGRLDEAACALLEQHLDNCSACASVIVLYGKAFAPQTFQSDERDLPAKDAITPLGREDQPMMGRYVLGHRLGLGGMGEVFSAHDPTLSRRVAIKVVRRDLVASEQQRLRVLREARAMARLSHPHVLPIYDAGTSGDDVFIAMELVEGMSLRAWLDAAPRSAYQILDVMKQAGSGLAAAHQAGIIHRDFKPDNVLVGEDGRVRVTDFGLAVVHSDSDPGGQGPDSGTIGGTPAYMAPEQWTGHPAKAACDQYAFCVTLCEVLSGQRPDRDPATGDARLHAPTSLPPSIAAVVARGLDVDPDKRFASMPALLQQLAGPNKRAVATVRLHVVLLVVMWILHALGTAVMIAALAISPSPAHTAEEATELASSDVTVGEVAFLGAFLLLTGWLLAGLVWTPLNVWGLLRTRPWARLSTKSYALACLPTMLGTAYGIYAVWSLSRREVVAHFEADRRSLP